MSRNKEKRKEKNFWIASIKKREGSWLGYGFSFIDLSGFADNFLSDEKMFDYLRNRASSVLVLPGSRMFVLSS